MNDQILSPQLLVSAYSQGYFPMPDDRTSEILWFRPDPRAIIPLDGFHVSKSLRRALNSKEYLLSYDKAFSEVMLACADRPTTWINDVFLSAYSKMHQLGFAHSVEVWQGDRLVGGTYGISLGGAFFAESMFHRVTNCSKIALYYLVNKLREQNFALLECQFLTPHLASLGATEVSDREYIKLLDAALDLDVAF